MDKYGKGENTVRVKAFQLEGLARRVESRVSWEDLTLPQSKLSQLKDICRQAREIRLTSREQDFDRRLSRSKGLHILLSGPRGTGKTLAARVLASELDMPLYKIDLSAVVSKYIGETEKNLIKLLDSAETSNAILFFDEADALFGKRTQVSDAHDRYTNIETGYLLQRIEEYTGIAILATNLPRNLDKAFVRRMQFVVEFPSPAREPGQKPWDMIRRWYMRVQRKA